MALAYPTATKGILLGPQRNHPTVGAEVEALGLKGPVALITCGWQEREPEDEELRTAIGLPTVNLQLHARADQVYQRDPTVFAAHRAKQDRLRRLQDIYRVRLDYGLGAARRLQELDVPQDLVLPEIEAALDEVRSLDARHLAQVSALNIDFESANPPAVHPVISPVRDEILAELNDCEAVVIAGGHVAIILNRIRLFGLQDALARKTVIAWSAGAMVVAERIVLFHDSPPQGFGNPEVLAAGLGLFGGIVVLPHSRHRLRLDDAGRVARFARRFVPASCVTFDRGSRVEWDGEHWHDGAGTRQLLPQGGSNQWP